MNFRKLITYLTMGTAAAMPLAVAQNPTILQGNYITNVFGNSNFVLNPNALTNVANVTNATRSTTTPLVATSEFTLSLASGANATWTLRAFDGGMKGQNCEARFTYRGFATATTKAEIVQNSLVVASLTLTPTTDPRIASINFPCGDLANLTTFRIAQTTAAMTGTNEIGGIYVGLATNMANVAQAETVVSAKMATNQTINTSGTVIWGTEELDVYGEFDSTTGIFTAKRGGQYQVDAQVLYDSASWTAGWVHELAVLFNGSSRGGSRITVEATNTQYAYNYANVTYSLNAGEQIKVEALISGAAITSKTLVSSTVWQRLTIKRFPSSSELVVTPERQNVWGAAKFTGSVVKSYTFPSNQIFNDAAYGSNVALYGKAKLQATGTCGTTNNLGICIETIPPGTYKVTVDGVFDTLGNTVGYGCRFQIFDGTNDAGNQEIYNPVVNIDQNLGVLSGLFNYTSVQTNKAFSVRVSGSSNQCRNILSSARPVNFTIEPLDQPSNSALYVQGPVLGAQTGAAISAGYVGEIKTNAQVWSGLGVNPNNFGAQIDLSPGVWIVTSQCDFQAVAPTDAIVATVDSSNAFIYPTGGPIPNMADVGNSGGGATITATQFFRVTAQKLFYTRCSATQGAGAQNTAQTTALRIN